MTLLLAPENCWIALVGLVLERVLGYPAWLYAAIRHPVVWVGALVGFFDRSLNRPAWPAWLRRLAGVAALAGILAAVLAVTLPIALAVRSLPDGWLVEGLLAASLIAQRDLDRYVAAVATGLRESLAAGRAAVRHIVGRDPEALDESGVAKGAIESLAENTADGVVAPLFWLLLAGLPGVALYKAINTADSMIGHRSQTYLAFGWATARLDDLVNLPASRLTGALFAIAAALPDWGLPDWAPARRAVAAMRRDAPRHVSPNAGWPEAAMAGALDIRLGGPRSYGHRQVDLPAMGSGRDRLTAQDIDRALHLYRRSLWLLLALVGFAALGVAARFVWPG